jgi:hypothetical protein
LQHTLNPENIGAHLKTKKILEHILNPENIGAHLKTKKYLR